MFVVFECDLLVEVIMIVIGLDDVFNAEVQKFSWRCLLCLVEKKLSKGTLKVARPSELLDGSSEQIECIQ